MKLVIFNNYHKLDLLHEIIYFDSSDLDDDSKIVESIKEFKPDFIIEEEKNDGKSLYNNIYKEFPGIPKVWWLIDAHCNLIDHVVYAKQFDYIFCAQSWFIPIIQREVLKKVFYLPLCHTQTLTEYEEMLKTPIQKDIDISFIGNIRSIHVERRKYVARFLEKYPDFFAHQADYETTLRYLRRSKTTFNCSLNNDLNFRVWEALACDAIPLTDYVEDISNITSLKEHLILYDKLIPDWEHLEMPLFSDRIEFIKSFHTLTHRMIQMFYMIEKDRQFIY